MSELDFGPPIRLPCSAFVRDTSGDGKPIKIKRGGVGKQGNSGTAPRRTRTFPRAIRDPKNGKILPWPPRAKLVWDPQDPFILALRQKNARPI